MNLGLLEQELDLIVQDPALKPYFRDWLNQALLEVAADFPLPGLKLLEPWPLGVHTGQWLYDMPENYLKQVFRVARGAERRPVVMVRTLNDLDNLDPDHNETGAEVNRVAVEANKLGIFPKADDTLYLWYYRRPVPMVNDGDEPDGIPAAFRARVLIPKVVIKNFRMLQDLMIKPPHQSLAWWLEEYRAGLYGSPRGDIGLLNFLAREHSPRRRGGRDPLP